MPLSPSALCGLAVHTAAGDLGSSCIGWLALLLENREDTKVQAPALKGRASTLTLSVLQVMEWDRESGQLFLPLAMWPWASSAPLGTSASSIS